MWEFRVIRSTTYPSSGTHLQVSVYLQCRLFRQPECNIAVRESCISPHRRAVKTRWQRRCLCATVEAERCPSCCPPHTRSVHSPLCVSVSPAAADRNHCCSSIIQHKAVLSDARASGSLLPVVGGIYIQVNRYIRGQDLFLSDNKGERRPPAVISPLQPFKHGIPDEMFL